MVGVERGRKERGLGGSGWDDCCVLERGVGVP